MAVSRFQPLKRHERRAEAPDLGMAPPIEADGGEHSAIERRRVSLRWLFGTVLTGLAGTTLIGAAIYAAFDRQSHFAEAPIAAGPVRRDVATGGPVSPGKGDRLVKPVDIAAGRQSFRTPTTVNLGEREVVRVKGFTRVSTNLLVASAGFSDEVPPFNPLRLLSDARNPIEAAAADIAPLRDDAEIAFTTRDISGLVLSEGGPSLSLEEIQAQIAEHVRNASAAAGQRPLALPPQLLLMRTSRASLDPAGGLGYANPNNPILAPFSSIEVRMVPENVTVVPRSPPASPGPQGQGQGQNDERLIVLKKNETLEEALRNSGVIRELIPRILAALGSAGRNLSEGQKIKLMFDDMDGSGRIGQVARLSIYVNDNPETTVAANDAGSFQPVARLEDASKGARQRPSSEDDDDEDEDSGGMRLYNAVYETALKQEIPKPLIAELIRIFANDVDFQRPVAASDSFEAFYEEGDDNDGRNELLYASITTRGETYRYYRFHTPDDGTLDYYDENGRSTRKFLIRKPIAIGEQRSTFGMRRHPILRYTRMHTGVDWSGPIGTPIFAAGNGVVTKAARESGYGNRVEIQHANGYVTTYNHLSGFARGISDGARVRQGQVIGFLGMTGLATGPHLHYEVMVNGHFVDPLRVRLARTRELDNRMLTNFKRERDRIESLMAKAPNATRVAAARTDTRPSVQR
jgi:murein DD-endopeptidase MepM/ murein hydrolase activator NlpD